MALFVAWLTSLALGQGAPVVERFLDELDARPGVTADRRDALRAAWSACEGCSPDEFLAQALIALEPGFAAAFSAYEAGDAAAARDQMGALALSPDVYLSTQARVYEVRALVESQDHRKALEKLSLLLERDRERTLSCTSSLAELEYLTGFCLLKNLDYQAAYLKLDSFLRQFPDAPARLRLSARQMLTELKSMEAGKMGEIGDLMGFAANRLRLSDSGDLVLERQQKAIDLLDQMIQNAEQQEQNSSNSNAQRPNQGDPSQNNAQPEAQQPMEDSRPPGGLLPLGPLRIREARPGEAWGAMPPAEREKVLQLLSTRFSPKYRSLVEQYYQELSKSQPAQTP